MLLVLQGYGRFVFGLAVYSGRVLSGPAMFRSFISGHAVFWKGSSRSCIVVMYYYEGSLFVALYVFWNGTFRSCSSGVLL